MDDTRSRIKFYSFGSEELDLSKISNEIVFDQTKPVRPSKNFNEALKVVIKKDIDVLNEKIDGITIDITKRLALNGTILENDLKGDVKSISQLITNVDELISNLIVEKGSLKVGLFSTNKKTNKERSKRLEDSIDFLSRCQNELISVKDEYNKLEQRNMVIEGALFDGDKEDEIPDEDPLERTINFYMNKQERN